MRFLLPLLLPAALCFADDLETDLRRLDSVRPALLEPGAKARVLPVVERLVASHDARVVGPLAAVVLDTLRGEERLFEESRRIQARGAAAVERMQLLDKQLAHLRVKERAGATDVGPEIERRTEERAEQERVFHEVAEQDNAISRRIDFARELRDKAVAGLAEVVGALDGAAADRALGRLRQLLDVADRTQSLLLVRILRDCGRPEAARHLIDVVNHTKAAPATVRAAATALARLRTPEGVRALIGIAERDHPQGIRPYVLHVLGLAAGRRLANLDEAREWAGTLG